jgi:hypothetical protein
MCEPNDTDAEPGFEAAASASMAKIKGLAELDPTSKEPSSNDGKEFKAAVEALDLGDFTLTAGKANTTAIYGDVMSVARADYAINCWWPYWRSRAVARDSAGRAIEWNCRMVSSRTSAQWAGTTMHELAHQAGYRHNGNSTAGNECTVPYVFGDLAEYIASGRKECRLPRCSKVRAKVVSKLPSNK